MEQPHGPKGQYATPLFGLPRPLQALLRKPPPSPPIVVSQRIMSGMNPSTRTAESSLANRQTKDVFAPAHSTEPPSSLVKLYVYRPATPSRYRPFQEKWQPSPSVCRSSRLRLPLYIARKQAVATGALKTHLRLSRGGSEASKQPNHDTGLLTVQFLVFFTYCFL